MKIPLTSGAYQAQSVIADAQRCVNLYPEANPADAPFPFTHYLTPGLERLTNILGMGVWRCLYTASNGDLYGVLKNKLYFISSTWDLYETVTLTNLTTPVSMADNGLYIMVVDGSINGWWIEMTARGSGYISEPNFYGGTRVDYIDGFFALNRPGTKQWYVSPANWTPLTPFDPLDIASKNGYPDAIQTLIVMHREVWLVGKVTTEIWYNAGAADFAFQAIPGAFIEHGTEAPYSIAAADLSVYFLSKDKQGNRMVMRGNNYQAFRISTHAIEYAISQYARTDDAIGFTYQQNGHVFYFLQFPSAGKTWVFDQSTELWHERAYTDPVNGQLQRHRANAIASAYGQIIVGDYENGSLYAFKTDVYQDFDGPISRIRSWPHLLDDNARVIYNAFTADMDVGDDLDSSEDDPPMVSLRWSDTKGKSWGNRVEQSLGATGQYLTNIQWSRLGLARDRVFEVSWSWNCSTALNGSYISISKAAN